MEQAGVEHFLEKCTLPRCGGCCAAAGRTRRRRTMLRPMIDTADRPCPSEGHHDARDGERDSRVHPDRFDQLPALVACGGGPLQAHHVLVELTFVDRPCRVSRVARSGYSWASRVMAGSSGYRTASSTRRMRRAPARRPPGRRPALRSPGRAAGPRPRSASRSGS